MNYKIYENVLDDTSINHILNSLDDSLYIEGIVAGGTRVNKKHKNRKDLFIKDSQILSQIDNTMYDAIYHDVKDNFCDIKFREPWKLGKYLGHENGFYKTHRDDTDEVAFRKTSMICALSDDRDYEGGELCFDDLNFKHKLKKGSCIVFKSSVFHHVNPVTSGTRIVLISFFFDEEGKVKKQQLSPTLRSFAKYRPYLKNLKLSYTPDTFPPDLTNAPMINKGDIDYSDVSKAQIWSDTDDFWLEENGSDTLLVSFAGMGWKTSIPTFIFHNFLKQFSDLDKLFLRDINCRYYLTGLKNSTSSLQETIEFVRSKIDRTKYKRVIGLGCSAGGYAAILYGHLLQFDKVVAFAPQTVLNEKKESLIGDLYNAPKTSAWLRQRELTNELYHNSLDLKFYSSYPTSIDIHYSIGGNRGIDKKHAEYLESTTCKLFEHPGNDHMIAQTLRNEGKLKEIIEDALHGV